MHLESLHVMPLHSGTQAFFEEDECYWACEFPEKPPVSGETCWDWRCRSCWLHAKASLADRKSWRVVSDFSADMTLGEAIVAADAYHRAMV